MKMQLTLDELGTIRKILTKHTAVERAVLFGSRALGTAKPGSDIDIALFGSVSHSSLSAIKNALEEETFLPYFFDMLAYSEIESVDLKKHIQKYGLMLFVRAPQIDSVPVNKEPPPPMDEG